jgi:hypothetical protein
MLEGVEIHETIDDREQPDRCDKERHEGEQKSLEQIAVKRGEHGATTAGPRVRTERPGLHALPPVGVNPKLEGRVDWENHERSEKDERIGESLVRSLKKPRIERDDTDEVSAR